MTTTIINRATIPLPALGVGITKVSILGDSIVYQMSAVQSTLPAPINGATILGVSGNTAAQIAARASSALGSSHVLIEGGTNDMVGLGTTAGIIPGYVQMLELLTSASQVRVIGIPHVDEAAINQSWLPYLNNAAIDAMNDQLINLCAKFPNCLPVIPAMRQDVTGLTVDGIHKTAKGYAAWAPLLAAGL